VSGSSYALRRATAGDVGPMVAIIVEGFETYRAFAPEAWTPPSASDEAERLPALLGEDHVWYAVAEDAGAIVGLVGFLAADRLQWSPSDDPALAHFRNLFVAPAHWGTGVATQLHAAAIDEARARGFRSMRLFTPAGQERARRFYEREGWEVTVAAFYDGRIGFEIVEYRYAL
jgi:GNAT superfamily N-acetyltransferase